MLSFFFNLGLSDSANGSGDFSDSYYGRNMSAEERAAYKAGRNG